jgi:hypothetical protein
LAANSATLRGPGIIAATAGWASGNCDAAAASGTPWLSQTARIALARATSRPVPGHSSRCRGRQGCRRDRTASPGRRVSRLRAAGATGVHLCRQHPGVAGQAAHRIADASLGFAANPGASFRTTGGTCPDPVRRGCSRVLEPRPPGYRARRGVYPRPIGQARGLKAHAQSALWSRRHIGHADAVRKRMVSAFDPGGGPRPERSSPPAG